MQNFKNKALTRNAHLKIHVMPRKRSTVSTGSDCLVVKLKSSSQEAIERVSKNNPKNFIPEKNF